MTARRALVRLEDSSDALSFAPCRGAGVEIGTTRDYSRFKHGDAGVAGLYGAALGDLFSSWRARLWATGVVVTASAYDVAPTAAAALVPSFVVSLAAHGVATRVVTVRRGEPSSGDYATWDRAERAEALRHAALAVPEASGVRGAHVVVLDDVRVTGTHERAMHRVLRGAGARAVDHLYVVDAGRLARDPTVESRLNHAAVTTVGDLLAVTRTQPFAPNARLARWVCSLDDAQLDEFLSAAAPALVAWLADTAGRDAFAQLDAYARGAARVRGWAVGVRQ